MPQNTIRSSLQVEGIPFSDKGLQPQPVGLGQVAAEAKEHVRSIQSQRSDRLFKQQVKDDLMDQEMSADEAEDIVNPRLKNLCQAHGGFGWTQTFGPLESSLAYYAITQLLNKYGLFVREIGVMEAGAEPVSIETGLNENSQVYRDFVAVVKLDGKVVLVNGMQNKEYYILGCASSRQGGVELFEKTFKDCLENSNFYRGASLKIGDNFVEFIRTPAQELSEVVLPEKVKKEYDLNITRFLADPEMHAITLRRGILLYGPPGTGKTSSVKGLLSELKKKGITAIHLSNEAMNKNRLTQIFAFINSYLSPCLVVMEDLDQIARDRDISISAYLGQLLNVLNGVEDQTKPIVILGTTNRPHDLDKAVTRPCRFDRKILIDYPSNEELRAIFEKTSGLKAPEGVIFQKEKADKKLTGAHIQEIVNTAKMLAVDRRVSVEECISEAVRIVTEDFVIINPGDEANFKGFDDGDSSPKLARPYDGNEGVGNG